MYSPAATMNPINVISSHASTERDCFSTQCHRSFAMTSNTLRCYQPAKLATASTRKQPCIPALSLRGRCLKQLGFSEGVATGCAMDDAGVYPPAPWDWTDYQRTLGGQLAMLKPTPLAVHVIT